MPEAPPPEIPAPEGAGETELVEPQQERRAPEGAERAAETERRREHLRTDTTRTRASRRNRGRRSAKSFAEEFGYVTEILQDQVEGELMSFAAMYQHRIEERQLSAMAASADPDTMYYHQAMAEPDK